MSSIIPILQKEGLITPPSFLADNIHYEIVTGSQSYGCSDDMSDIDIVGFCIPPKETIFPHTAGYIKGFGTHQPNFDGFQQHHIQYHDKDDNPVEYDINCYNIVRYFQLCMENNPNMIDTLFSPIHCVRHCTSVGKMVVDNRHIFLHKGCWHKFKGYAYSQLLKINSKDRDKSKRKVLIEKYGYDTKFAANVLRLLLECEQILTEGTLDLTRNKEILKAIRRGEWPESRIREFFSLKERELEPLYHSSKLPYCPDENAIKQLLLRCLESHYGNLNSCIVNVDKALSCIQDIKRVIEKYNI